MSRRIRYVTEERGGEDMNTHPDVRVSLACAYLAEVLERARQEELRRSVAGNRDERRKTQRRRLVRRARVPQEAA